MSLDRDGYTIEGYEELVKKIDSLEGEVDKDVSKALKAGGEVIAKQLETNTPTGDSHRLLSLKGNVKVSNTRKDRDTGQQFVVINYSTKNPDVQWRVHFVEFGTIRQRPQLFMTKTFEQTQSKAQEAIFNELKKTVDKL